MIVTCLNSKAINWVGAPCPLYVLACGVLLLFSGCASTPDKEGALDTSKSQALSDLYDGKSTVTYATEFPVATAEEARQRGDLALRQVQDGVDIAVSYLTYDATAACFQIRVAVATVPPLAGVF